jgi:hypothetical protein
MNAGSVSTGTTEDGSPVLAAISVPPGATFAAETPRAAPEPGGPKAAP